MSVRGAEGKAVLSVRLDALPTIPALYFLLHQIFALSISYFYTVISSDALTRIVVYTYRLRDVCFVFAVLFILLKQRLTWDSVIVSFLLFASYTLTKVVYPDNSIYLAAVRPYLVLGVGGYIVIRSRLVDWETLRKSAACAARVLTVLASIGLINVSDLPRYLNIHYMTFSNAMLLPTAITIFSAYDSNSIYRIVDIALSLFGLFMTLLFGARGAFLLLFTYAVVIIFMETDKRKVLIYGMIAMVITIIGLGLLSTDNVLLSFMGGQRSRTIERLLSGNLFTSNRNNIYSYLIQKSLGDRLLGHGMCADRYYLPFQFRGSDANHAHNYYIEMLVDFGILGVIVSTAVTVLIFKRCIKLRKSKYKAFMLGLFFVAFLQLMVSRSWLTEANFFIFMGLLMTYKNGIGDDSEGSRACEGSYEKGVCINTNLS